MAPIAHKFCLHIDMLMLMTSPDIFHLIICLVFFFAQLRLISHITPGSPTSYHL